MCLFTNLCASVCVSTDGMPIMQSPKREVGTIVIWPQARACWVRVKRERERGWVWLVDSVEVSVMACFISSCQCQPMHPSLILEGQSRVYHSQCVLASLNQFDGVGMSCQLRTLSKSLRKWNGFGDDVIAEQLSRPCLVMDVYCMVLCCMIECGMSGHSHTQRKRTAHRCVYVKCGVSMWECRKKSVGMVDWKGQKDGVKDNSHTKVKRCSFPSNHFPLLYLSPNPFLSDTLLLCHHPLSVNQSTPFSCAEHVHIHNEHKTQINTTLNPFQHVSLIFKFSFLTPFFQNEFLFDYHSVMTIHNALNNTSSS